MNVKATQIRIKTCKWCGRSFIVPRTRKYNAVKYCCEMHRYYARLEQCNKNQQKYLHKYRNIPNCSKHLGTGQLGSHPADDFKKEYELIKKELKRRRLK